MNYVLNNLDIIARLVGEHLYMTGVALLLSTLIALPVSSFLYQREQLATAVLGILGTLYTIPSIALLILLLPIFGLDSDSVIAALIIYTQIILVRNTVAGLQNVPSATIEAATGMGMTAWQRWYKIQLPLALPIILAGVRIAAVVATAIATIGAKFGAGGLGTLLFDGIAQNRYDKIWAGTIIVSLLAVALNWGIAQAENYFDIDKRIAKQAKTA